MYYYFEGNSFIFASELQAITEHDLDLRINKRGVNFFFYQKYIGGDLTIFENCFKVRPSENILFDLQNKKLTKTKYYDLEAEIAKCQKRSISERLGAIEGVIVDAVQQRLVADVPVGSFLSGGVDWSLLSARISTDQ